MARASSWTNSDGLVVGFGPNTPELANGYLQQNVAGAKMSAVTFNWRDINANRAVSAPVPAGSRVLDVKLVIHENWAGSGNALIVGDGSTTNGYFTTSRAAVANLLAGTELAPDGVYAFGATDTGAAELKYYATADTIDVDSADTDWTAGSASLVVTYL